MERMSLSPYCENLIIKSGFLIAAMFEVDKRTTMDMDTTVKGLPVCRESIEKILGDIIAVIIVICYTKVVVVFVSL